jgi:hypothetical protein
LATKTLSVDEEAYRKLARARRHPKESFSQIIKRAEWDTGNPRCGGLLSRTDRLPPMAEDILDRLDRAQIEDHPPDAKWKR